MTRTNHTHVAARGSTSAPSSASDRRACRRTAVDRPAKLQLARTGRYLAGRSINVADGGVLVQLHSHGAVPLREPVSIALARPGQGVIRSKQMRWATVVRCEVSPQGWRVALAYDEPRQVEAQPAPAAA